MKISISLARMQPTTFGLEVPSANHCATGTAHGGQIHHHPAPRVRYGTVSVTNVRPAHRGGAQMRPEGEGSPPPAMRRRAETPTEAATATCLGSAPSSASPCMGGIHFGRRPSAPEATPGQAWPRRASGVLA